MRMATLITGAKVPEPAVTCVYAVFNVYAERGWDMFIYELFKLCGDPHHRLFGKVIGPALKKDGLLKEFYPDLGHGVVDDTICHVVLAAITDRGGGRFWIEPNPQNIILSVEEVKAPKGQ